MYMSHHLLLNQHYVHTYESQTTKSTPNLLVLVDGRIVSTVVVFSRMRNAIKRTTTIYRSIEIIISLIWTHTCISGHYFTISHCLVWVLAVFIVFFLLKRYKNGRPANPSWGNLSEISKGEIFTREIDQ